jgi:hypothetical protein
MGSTDRRLKRLRSRTEDLQRMSSVGGEEVPAGVIERGTEINVGAALD